MPGSRRRDSFVAALLVGLLLGGVTALPAQSIGVWQCDVSPETVPAEVRRIYAPYSVPASESAVFWFGRVTESENYTDVRVRYTDAGLLLSLGIMDRLLWYDNTPSAAELTLWDSVSLYLNRDGIVGDVPDAQDYRFDAQLDWWEPVEERPTYQAAYRGDGSGWILAPTSFTTSAGWNGNAPNDDIDDRGWMLYYSIPFTSLGLDGPPAQGTVWGLGVAAHDRDSREGPPLADEAWPEALDPLRPSTWGQLVFGLKPAYVPPSAVGGGTTVVRHGLDGVQVTDADVGGSSICGAPAAPGFFSTWGELNWAGKEFLNIQHVDPISEWPCFSKYYVTFPLDSMPTGKTILSATLTLYQNGNAGEDDDPQPSFIEVFTIGEDWAESTVTWNSAPLAGDYVAATWVNPLEVAPPPWPGIPRHWDVSGAVAEAYVAGQPLRLALYSPDSAFHSGKYFFSSDIGGGGEGRPTLTVRWGSSVPSLAKAVAPTSGGEGDVVTFTLGIQGDGGTLALTDTLPSGLAVVTWGGTYGSPIYDSAAHALTWSAAPPAGQPVTLTYSTRIVTDTPEALTGLAVLTGADGIELTASSTVLANPYRIALPLILKQR